MESLVTATPTVKSTPSRPEYELQVYQSLSKTFTSSFVNELRTSTPKYTALESQDKEPQIPAAGHISQGKVNTGYNPLFTRRWVLLCFSLLWVLIITSLQILYSVSQTQNGLVTTNNSLRYLWAYGPTAFLVVVTVTWRQIDYAGKYSLSCHLFLQFYDMMLIELTE